MDTRKRARCTGKVKHKSKGKAEAALRALLRLEPDADMQVYACSFGRHWHVGHVAVANPKNKYRKGAGSAKKTNPKTTRD
jgi:hypothetical protein